ncbi:MAG: Smr/MutS family protein [Burkholderiales bacterium]
MRKLSDEEQGLWERLKQTVRPLPRRRAHAKPPAATQPAPQSAKPHSKKPKPASAASVKVEPKPKPSEPSLAAFEEKTRRRLSRGLAAIDERIDLHGMRQERAHSQLIGFLRRAQARGSRIVIVVTGKGTVGDEGRGVLREMVPHWLSRPDLRDLVVGFEEAGRRHGGAGALYVRIRRQKSGRNFP